MTRRVRVGACYRYDPVPLDRFDPPAGKLVPGELVTVIRLHGCPPPNAMGHCYVARADGSFGGLVHTNSLQPRRPRAVCEKHGEPVPCFECQTRDADRARRDAGE